MGKKTGSTVRFSCPLDPVPALRYHPPVRRTPRVTAVTALTAAVLLPLLGVACESRPDPAALFLQGEYLAARSYYNPTACAQLPVGSTEARECEGRAHEIEQAVASAVRYLGKRANALTAARKQIHFNAYGDAITALEAALEIMLPTDPNHQAYQEGISRIRNTVASLEQEREEQIAKLEGLLEEDAYDPEVWRDIRRTFERLRVLSLALRQFDGRPAQLALAYVKHFAERGQFERASIATELALAVDERALAHPDTREVTREQLISFAFIDFRARRQQRQREKQISELLAQLNQAIQQEQRELAVSKARATLALYPDAATTRRLNSILASLEGHSTKEKRAELAKVAVAPVVLEPVPVPPEPASEATPVNVMMPSPTMTATVMMAPTPPVQPVPAATAGAPGTPVPPVPPVPPGPTPAEVRELEEQLGALLERFEAGQELDAILGLEALIAQLEDSPLHKRAMRLRSLWDPDRHRLVRDLVAEADRLFVQMDDRSLAHYRQAQQLNPSGRLADHIAERIATLERILSD